MKRMSVMNVRLILCVFVLSIVLSMPVASFAKQSEKAQKSAEKVEKGKSVSLVDINEAGIDELTTLPGIGEKTAEKIVDYRKKNGPFESVDDLKNVEGIGEKKLEKLKAMATVKNDKGKAKKTAKDESEKASEKAQKASDKLSKK